MPQIIIKKKNKKIQANMGANLMRTLLANDIPVASSCDGEGICHKCGLVVTSNQSSEEILSCQFKIMNDIEVDAKYW